MKMSKSMIVILILAALFIVTGFIFDFTPGKEIGFNFRDFFVRMVRILPFAFILIGLFEVWVKRETVERHLGIESGWQGYAWAILLSGTTVGGLYVAFPIAYALHNKGARLSVIFTYLSSAAITRIPMSIFEASFLGVKFTAIRILVSLPLVIMSSMFLGNYLTHRKFQISRPEVEPAAKKTTGQGKQKRAMPN
jgi:uncharacterized membrane protein YraQ (UPF0718 family)